MAQLNLSDDAVASVIECLTLEVDNLKRSYVASQQIASEATAEVKRLQEELTQLLMAQVDAARASRPVVKMPLYSPKRRVEPTSYPLRHVDTIRIHVFQRCPEEMQARRGEHAANQDSNQSSAPAEACCAAGPRLRSARAPRMERTSGAQQQRSTRVLTE